MATIVDTGTEDLQARIENRVGVLAFNRPEARNALSPGMYLGIDAALTAMRADDEVRCVMLTGANGAFCAGGDVKAMNQSNQTGTGPRAEMSNEERIADIQRRQRSVSLALHEFPKPVVAAIEGACAGAGFSMAMATDMRIATPDALIVTAFANIGASGDFGGSWFLSRLLGEAKAKELYFRSPRLSGIEAAEIGLVNEVLDGEGTFQEQALLWCEDIAARAPLALSKMKENINRATTVDLATALDREAENMVLTMRSQDHKEAAAAFVEKRTPVFRGE
ncbi:MAG: enoyl-CoA hydratase-related protein [Actinomycetota bacterium]